MPIIMRNLKYFPFVKEYLHFELYLEMKLDSGQLYTKILLIKDTTGILVSSLDNWPSHIICQALESSFLETTFP